MHIKLVFVSPALWFRLLRHSGLKRSKDSHLKWDGRGLHMFVGCTHAEYNFRRMESGLA